MNLQDVRSGIANALSAIQGLKVFDYIPDSAVPPMAIVGWPTVWSFHQAMHDGVDDAPDIPVWLMVGSVSDRAANKLLATYCQDSGDPSVKAAIETDTTLNGACDDLLVTQIDGFKPYSFGSATAFYLGCVFHIHVIGS